MYFLCNLALFFGAVFFFVGLTFLSGLIGVAIFAPFIAEGIFYGVLGLIIFVAGFLGLWFD